MLRGQPVVTAGIPVLRRRLPLSPEASLIAAGHLGGRSRRTVIDARSVITPGHYRQGLTARDARTGRPLWHRVLSPGGETVLPEPVGSKGEPGLVLTSESLSGSQHRTTFVDRVRALRGDTGATLWTRSFSGYITFHHRREAQHGQPAIFGLVHDRRGRQDEILVTLTSGRTNHNGTVTPYLISTRDGSVISPGGTIHGHGDPPEVLPAPDETGDGLGDLLVVKPGDPGYVRLVHGNTAKPVWTTQGNGVYDGTGIQAVGEISGGSVPDLAVTDLKRPPPDGLTDRVSLLRGSDGTVLWTRPATFVESLGIAGANGTPAVGLLTLLYGDLRHGHDSYKYAAIDATGNPVYSRRFSLSLRSGDPISGSGITEFGDVQPDGSQDLEFQEFGPHQEQADAVLSGRDASVRRFRFDAVADGSLQHGTGTDLLRYSTTKTGITLQGLDGATGAELYRRAVPSSVRAKAIRMQGLRITGHACSDLALATANRKHDSIALLNARGRRLWTVTFSASDPTGGVLHRYPAPQHDCVA
ncbi:MAG: hypothetical protein JO246_02005 [Frankiaceae bacterium]|nr:hypothetical protein [Frankiaceae bacterium]